MPEFTKVYRREELYREIWERPMREVAKRYGVSDVALAKACQKLNVPRPGRGFWARRAAGHNDRPAPLPPLKPGESNEYKVTKWLWPSPPPPTPAELEIKARPECQPKLVTLPFSLHVASRVTHPHPLVAKTWADLKRRTANWHGVRTGGDSGGVPVKVSDSEMSRAIRILDAFVRGIERAGHRVLPADYPQTRSARIVIEGVQLDLRLRERMRQSKEPLTAEQKKWAFSETRWMQPTGELILTVVSDYPHTATSEWSDLPDKRLEHQINDAFKGVLELAAVAAAKKAEWTAIAELQAAEERKKAEVAARVAAKRRAEEAARRREQQWAEALVEQAERWERAISVQRFVDAVARSAGATTDSAQLAAWLAKARRVAEELNPIPAMLALPPAATTTGIEAEDP